VLHYTFEDLSGGVVTDISGIGNHGILRGGASATDGFEGNGLACTVKADYIEAPDNINTGLSSFTFTTWVKFSALKNATRFFDWGTGADGTNNFLIFVPSYNGDDGYMTLRYRPLLGAAYNVTSDTKCRTGAWEHVAVTFEWNGSSGTANIYLNGEIVGSGSGLPYNPETSLGSTADNYFGYSRWSQDLNGFNGIFDDLRVYDRALSYQDIQSIIGLDELQRQYDSLDLGDISGLTEDINLPTVLGGGGVTAAWATSNQFIISSSGDVTRPEKYDRSVVLTATLSYQVNDVVHTREKTFIARVKGMTELPEHICRWTFDAASTGYDGLNVTVTDKTTSAHTGILMNEAEIRTIGDTSQFNVLYTGNGSGYFDMGTGIGEKIYALEDHTIMCYFRIDADYGALSSNGNFLYAFSNTARADLDKNGYVIGRLNITGHQCTKHYWNEGKMEVAVGSPAGKGAWHHYAYVQNGTTGSIYIDGDLAAEGVMTQLPSADIAIYGREGTLHNWLGRSIGLPSDVYLRKTMIYDFNLFSKALSAGELDSIYGVTDTIALLDAAYGRNPDYKSAELLSEYNNLDLGDLSALSADLDLPEHGPTYNEVSIMWNSSREEVINTSGNVSRPGYFDYDVTLTATLTHGNQMMVKSFTATVLAAEGTPFLNELLVRFDFSNLDGSTVLDVAEKQFPGTLVNEASIVSMGTQETGIYNVLDLGLGTGYFDMGAEVGKVIGRLDDYTISAYYRVNEGYALIGNPGNLLWTFANSDDAAADQNGSLTGSLSQLGLSITPGYYTNASGNQEVSISRPALRGDWHHMAYTQEGNTGTLYMDGIAVVTTTVTNLPSNTLLKEGIMGTAFNWIGRSCYTSDAYLRNSLVYDLRIYNRALSGEEILQTGLNVSETLILLDQAYDARIADSRTDETSIPEKPEREYPSFLEIMKDELPFAIADLNSIQRISFEDTQFSLHMKNGKVDSYSRDEFRKIIFSGHGATIVQSTNIPDLLLYPNPALDHIILSIPDPGPTHIRIYSVTGQQVMNAKIQPGENLIDVSRLRPGIYFVNTGLQVAKFMKQ
jgi:hypothetical protein